jgi:Predicted redox protein, regulator of disulfide bond formation
MTFQVVVSNSADQKYRQKIKAGGHSLVSDISAEQGGTEEGFDPHELLLASLGACTSITVKMYAERKGYPLKDVTVTLREEKIADPENESRSMPKIIREIALTGELTDEQVESLKTIADKCPIHKLLSGPKQISTEVARAGQAQPAG